jgi:ketosteroid isomerase-like protein
LKDAALLNGPLNAEIQKKINEVNERLAQALRKEEKLWQQAKSDVDRNQFEAAKKALEQIQQIPEGQGTRREDAETYLTQVIPQRQREEDLLAKVKQDVSKKDRNSLTEALRLSDQIIQLGGPRKADAERLRQSAQTALTALDKQELAQQIAVLEAAVRVDLKQGNFPSAREKIGKIKQAGGDASSLSTETDKAETAAKARQQDDVNYQQAVQKYNQALAANDKSGIDAARDSFMWIAKGGGPHADEAHKKVSEINERNTTAQLAPALPPPAAKQEIPATKGLDEAAVRDVINRYQQAFEQRNADAVLGIWQNMGSARYRRLKNTFNTLAEQHYQVTVETIEVSQSGDEAVATGGLLQSSTAKGGEKSKPRRDSVSFALAKSNGKWFVTDVK